MKVITTRRSSAWRNAICGTLVALGLTALMPGRSWAACKIKSIEMPVTMVGSRAVATLGINGSDVPLFVDSGAFFSFLTLAAAQQLKLEVGSLPRGMRIEGLTGEVPAGLTTVKRLKLLDGEVPDMDFVVGGNDESTGTMGVIGRNLLAFTDIEYDLANGMIRLMFPNDDCGDLGMAYWAEGKPVSELNLLRDESRPKTPAAEAVVLLNDKKLRVLFDTGARSMVSLSAAKRAGITDLKPAGKVRGAGRGEAEAWTGAVDSFELGSEKVLNIRLPVADFQLGRTDMLLGIDFFLSHRIYVAKKQRRMYFTYNGGPVFALSAVQNAKALAASPPASGASAPAPAPADGDEALDAAGYARRGAAASARLDFAQALADLDKACALAPEMAEYFARRGTVHEQLRQRQAALKDYDEALRLAPAQTEARLRRAWLRIAGKDLSGTQEDAQLLDQTLAPQSHQRLQLAQLYERLDQPERALAQWDQWIPAHPHDVALASVLNSRCWMQTLRNVSLDQAREDCEQAIDLQDKNPTYYNSRAWLRLRSGEWRKALADYERALKLKPDSAWALYGRGIVRRKLGEEDAGQADIEAARKLAPTIDAQTGRRGLAADAKAP